MKIKEVVKGEKAAMPHNGMWAAKAAPCDGFVFVMDASEKNAAGVFVPRSIIQMVLRNLEKKKDGQSKENQKKENGKEQDKEILQSREKID